MKFEKLRSAPNALTHPNAFAWSCLVSKFAKSVRNGWTSESAPATVCKHDDGETKEKRKKDKKGGKKGKEPVKSEDADFDPFTE